MRRERERRSLGVLQFVSPQRQADGWARALSRGRIRHLTDNPGGDNSMTATGENCMTVDSIESQCSPVAWLAMSHLNSATREYQVIREITSFRERPIQKSPRTRLGTECPTREGWQWSWVLPHTAVGLRNVVRIDRRGTPSGALHAPVVHRIHQAPHPADENGLAPEVVGGALMG
jgi:hypothetical protein